MNVSIIGQVDGMTSHGLHLAQLVKRLPKHGISPIVRPRKIFAGAPAEVMQCVRHGANDCEVEIILGQPRLAPTPGKRTIYICAWESTKLPERSVKILNTCACVVVPSQFCAQVFSSCGVTSPIYVVPLGVSEAFTYRPSKNKQPFTFACVGNLGNGPTRKGVRRVVDHFLSAFKPDENVRLKVKLHPGQSIGMGDTVDVTAKFMPESEWADWLSDCDCLIHYGVGAFELVPLEAMALGRPVISLRWGGHADFFNSDVGIEVSHRLEPATDSWRGLGHFAVTDEDSAIAALRWALHSADYLERIGMDAARSVRHLTWENHATKIAGIVKSLASASNEITVVFPVCQHDVPLAIRHAEWMRKLVKKFDGRWDRKAVIVRDNTLAPSDASRLESLLRECFEAVEVCLHPEPPEKGWPAAPNWVFQHAARHMAKSGEPWLWFEADCVLLSADGWERLQSTYSAAKKRFMGPLVQGMGHMNGCGVYPGDTPSRAPSAMRCSKMPFDYEMKPDMIHDCHDASDLIQHIWTMRGRDYSENSGGDLPTNISAGTARRWLKKTAVMVHRIKDTSLTDMLITGAYRHG